MNRPDFIFSDWIFIWYILYELSLTTYSPRFALVLALLVNILTLIAMIYFKNSVKNIILFCIINFFIKIIPLWTLRHTRFILPRDVVSSVFLFVVYFIWMQINDKSFILFYTTVQQDKPIGPITYYIDKVWK